MVDVSVDFVLENDEPIQADFELEPDVTYTADIMLSSASSFHNELYNRDLPDQHPMSAITDLEETLDSKVEKTDESSKVYGTNENGEQTTYELDSFGKVDDVQVGGVSVVTNKVAELGTMAGETASDYSTTAVADTLYANISYEETINNHIDDKDNPHEVTKAQVGLGNCDNTSDLDKPISTATQEALDSKQATISDLSTIRENAAHGESAYNTISGYGDIVTHNTNEFATAAQGSLADTAVQPNDLATVATSGSYNDLSNKPTIGNATLTIQKNGDNVDTFTANATSDKVINITVPTTASDVGALPDTTTINDLTTTAQQNALNSGANTTNIGQIAINTQAISDEATNRENADIGLQNQIDAIVSSSDVFDIVGTYAELQAYDITTVPVNDIIKVLVDETHSGAATYYRCVENGGVKSWSYIGSEGAYYTKGEADSTFVPQTRTVNSKALSSNITLTASDVGALPSSTVIPTVNNATLTIQKNGATVNTFTANASSNVTANIIVPTATSDLMNDSGYITSAQLDTKQDKLTSANAGTDISIVSEILPSAYKRVTGFSMNNDCYFEITGFHLKGSDTIRFSITPTAGAINVLGCYTSSSATDNYSLYVGLGVSNKYLRYNGGTYSSQIVANTKYDVVITPTGATGLEQSSTWTAQTFTSVADFCIGTTSSSATSSKFMGTFHGEIVVDGRARFIPCERLSDNVLGYYEYESGTFYTPAVGTPVSTGYDNVPALTISFTNDSGFITGITSGDVTSALGYTPYDSSNPNGYTSNVGTVTSVNNVSPDSNGNVTLAGVTVDQTYDSTSANAQSGVAIAGALGDYVTTNTTQTITGVKTLTNALNVDIHGTDARMAAKFEDISLGTFPSADYFAGFTAQDSNGTYYASADCIYRPDGTVGSNLWAKQNGAEGFLGVYVSDSGNVYTRAPTPATADNSTNIATTAYVKAQGYTSNVGTVTSVNNVSPVSGNVTLSIPTATSDLTNDSGFITGISSSDVTTALGYTPADDSNVVKTTGNQNISGAKKYANNHSLVVRNANVTKGTNPSAQQYWNIGFTDTNSADHKDRLGVVECYLNTDGSSQMQLKAYKNVAQSTTTEYIGITYPTSGSAYTYAPTPATSDNSTKIATTAYVKAQGYAVDSGLVHTTGNETIAGTKTFSNTIKLPSGINNIGNESEYRSQLYRTSSGTGNLALAMNKQDNSGWMSSITLNTDGNIAISPSGSVTAPTPATSDNSTKIATTAFVNNWVTANTSNVHVVVDTYESGSSWYRVYDDGWIEQGGWKSGFSSANTFENVTLHKPFADTYYNVQVSGGGSATTIYNYKIGNSATNTTTAFKLLASNTGAACFWYACGMGA